MNKQEHDHLEKTLAILSDKLHHSQAQYIETKKTVHAKKTFLLSCKSLLQQDAAQFFQSQDVTPRRKRRRILPPPGLLPLLGGQGATRKTTDPSPSVLTPASCTGTILQDRIWLRIVVNHDTSLPQMYPIWMASAWTPTDLNRSTACSASHETVLYAATTLPPFLSPTRVKTMDIKLAVRYRLENGDWMDSAGRSIDWVGQEWIMNNDLDTIDHWAPILYPYKAHLGSPPLLKDWISLNPHTHLAPDASVMIVQGSDHFSPLQGQVYGLQKHGLAALDAEILPWDGVARDTQGRVQQTIVALVDQAQTTNSSSSSILANREHSLAQLATLLSSSFIEPL